MVHLAESVLRTESPKQLPCSPQWPAALQSESGKLVSRHARQTGGTSDALNRPVKPAELAQARIFKSALQGELARLNELASRLGGPSERFRAGEYRREHHELGHIYAGIDEVRRLLEGLRGRFGPAD